MSGAQSGFWCLPVTGIGEVGPGDDLAALLGAALPLEDGDILVLTSKVVSKAEGRVVTTDRATAIADETSRVVARRTETSIVRTRHGFVMAAAGVDASNTRPGTVVLLPLDPDLSARTLRARIASGGGQNVGVVITDTFGRAWRNGQTDVAIGAAGLEVMQDYSGRPDGYGNLLSVTAPAVADEIAGAADLVKQKLTRSPAAVLRGLGHLVCPRGDLGPAARELIRDEGLDMFGYGAREAVLQAVERDADGIRGFGHPGSAAELVAVLRSACPEAHVRRSGGSRVDVLLAGTPGDAAQRVLGALEARLLTTAFAMGWTRDGSLSPPPGPDVSLRFSPATP